MQAGSQQTWCPAVDAWLKRTMAGWRACFITADRELLSGISFKPSKRTLLFDGALDCRLEFQERGQLGDDCLRFGGLALE